MFNYLRGEQEVQLNLAGVSSKSDVAMSSYGGAGAVVQRSYGRVANVL